MRILILHNFYQHHGGEDTVVKQEAEALSKRGHQVKTLHTKNKKLGKGLLQFLLYPFNIFVTNSFIKEIEDYKPEIIHIHNLHYAIGPFIIRKLKKKGYPIVMTLHNFRLICPSATMFYDNQLHTESINQDFPWTAIKNRALDHSFFKTLITGFTYWLHKKLGTWNMVDRFIIMSSFNKNCFIEAKIGLKDRNITLKPNFVDLPKTTSDLQREKHFLYVGRISSEKGIEQIVNHFTTLNASLKIIGEGPLMHRLQLYSKNSSNIEWLGAKNKEEVDHALKQCKAIIVPSVCYEGAVPLTILEAMATKTPILASNIGSIPHVIMNEKSGWLFDPHSEESLSQVITDFNNTKKSDTITDTAYNIYLDNFEKNIIINKLICIYQEVINKK